MRTYDLSPLLRSTIGFDRFDRMFDTLNRAERAAPAYPPYNIVKSGEDDYRLTMAVAGFAEDDLDVTVKENILVITGKAGPEAADTAYLHRGIARRAFERRFDLADTVRVTGAALADGLLHVDFVREVPEAKKPRRIAIAGTGGKPSLERKAA